MPPPGSSPRPLPAAPLVGARAGALEPKASPGMSVGQLGLLLVLASISVLFVATALAVIITHAQAPAQARAAEGAVPWGVVGSSVFLAALSYCLHCALLAVRRNLLSRCLQQLSRAGGLALAFLAAQTLNLGHLAALEAGQKSPFAVAFVLLVGIHALHVIGGLVPLGLVLLKVHRREYSSSRHEGLRLCAQYWHYLGVVWLFLLATLVWVR